MSNGEFSEYQVHKWLADFATCWVALHHSDPRVNGAYASEIFGNGYSRCRATFSTPSARVTWNSKEIIWTALPTIRATHVSMWDTQYGGNMLASIALSNRIQLISGNTLKFAPSTVALSQ